MKIHRDLGATRSLGVHWGQFKLIDEALDEPPRALARVRAAEGIDEDAFFVIAIREMRIVSRRMQPEPILASSRRPDTAADPGGY